MSSADATRSHPAPEVLAGLDDELLPPEQEADIRGHLEGCRDCRTSVARVGQVREALAAGQERMPADVVARIGAAVHTAGSARRAGQARRAAAATASVDPAAGAARGGAATADRVAGEVTAARRRAGGNIPLAPPAVVQHRARGWALAAAAGVVLVLGVTLAAGLLRGTDTDSTSAASGAAAAPATSRSGGITESGRDYTPATVAAGVGVRAGTGKAAAGAGAASAPSALSGGSPLRSPAALARCVADLAGRPGVAPLRVDLAAFQHEPAAVIVLPVLHHPDRVQVWVVGPYCTTGAPDIRYFVPGVPLAR